MKPINQILKPILDRPENGYVTQEFQATALMIIKKLNIPRSRYSAYFGAVKKENPLYISQAFTFAIDHPNIFARDKMFFWKLNDLKRKKNDILT